MAWINPNIPEGYSFIKDTLKFYVYQHGDILSRATDNFYYDYTSGANKADVIGDIRNYSFSSGLNANLGSVHSENNYTTFGHILSWFPIMTIRVNTTTNPITVSYSNDSEKTSFTTYPYFNWWYQINNAEKIIITNDTNWEEKKATEFSTLLSALQYIHNWYANVNIYVDDELWIKAGLDPTYTSNGGGATHIAKATGQLKDLSSNLSDILIVSGGGGGGYLVGENAYNGADAGGISGSGNNSGNQSSGYAFGQGESGTNVSGGGSGLYGGTKNGTSSTIIMNSWCKTTDYNNHRQSSHRHNFTVNFNTDVVSELSSYLGSDYILEYLGDNPSGGMYSQVPIAYDGDNNVFYSSVYNKHIALPIKPGIGKIIKLAFSYTNKSSGTYAWIQVGLLKINGSTTTTLKYAQYSSTGNYELTLDTPSEADYLWICNAEDLFEISNMTMYVQASIMNEAGAGSGYIGNSLVSNKKMVGYNVPTSDAEGTKTESVNEISASAVSGKPKSGNGFARIKFLRDS